jgi:ribokinase
LSRRKPIVIVGSINLDLVAVTERIPSIGETVIGTDFQIHPGGKGANQAVAVARLGYPARMIGRLGEDAFGVQLRANLESAGVDIAGVATSEGPSGVAVIEVSGKGENSIIVAQGANSKLTPEDIDHNLPMIREAGLVLVQLEIPFETVEHLCSVCSRENVSLIFDPAPARELPGGIFSKIDWFTPNETEAAFYVSSGQLKREGNPPEVAAALLAKGCRGVVLKMGAHGLCLAAQNHPTELLPAFPVKAIDTTAAGDAFNGAFAVGLMLGKSAHDSALFAAGAAAVSVTRPGAQPSMPSIAEVKSFIDKHQPVQS